MYMHTHHYIMKAIIGSHSHPQQDKDHQLQQDRDSAAMVLASVQYTPHDKAKYRRNNYNKNFKRRYYFDNFFKCS